MQLVFAVVVALLAQAQAEAAWRPSMQDTQSLEGRIVLPIGAYPLGSYERYYTGFIREGRKMIHGYLYQGRKPGIYLSPSPIAIADGGCSVVEFEYDLAAQRTEEARCNGVA